MNVSRIMTHLFLREGMVATECGVRYSANQAVFVNNDFVRIVRIIPR